MNDTCCIAKFNLLYNPMLCDWRAMSVPQPNLARADVHRPSNSTRRLITGVRDVMSITILRICQNFHCCMLHFQNSRYVTSFTIAIHYIQFTQQQCSHRTEVIIIVV